MCGFFFGCQRPLRKGGLVASRCKERPAGLLIRAASRVGRSGTVIARLETTRRLRNRHLGGSADLPHGNPGRTGGL